MYTNSQELIAIANLFNINLNIFTYNGDDMMWTQVCPDPEMVSSADFGKWIPDLALYHSQDSHYDLLVKVDSHLALVGFFRWKSAKGRQ